MHGLPKLAQLQCSIDECDLVIGKEWQPYLTDQARNVKNLMFFVFPFVELFVDRHCLK